MCQLTISGPHIPSQRRALTPGSTLSLGRAEDNDVVLPSDCVSRHHLQLKLTSRGLQANDLGSRNGTLLNGRQMSLVSRSVGEGDVLTLGEYVIKVETGAPAEVQGSAFDDFITLRTSSPEEDNPFMTRRDWRATLPNRRAGAIAQTDSHYAPLLFQLAERLAGGMELMAFLREVLSCSEGVTGYRGAVLLAEAEGALRVEVGGHEGFVWSRTLYRAAVERKSTLFVNHLRTDTRFNMAASVVSSGYLHVLCSPLLRERETLGAIYLYSRGAPPPSQAAVDFVSSIAQLAAVAVERCGREARSLSPSVSRTPPPSPGLEDSTSFLQNALAEMSRSLSRVSQAPDRGFQASQLEELQLVLSGAQDAARTIAREILPELPGPPEKGTSVDAAA